MTWCEFREAVDGSPFYYIEAPFDKACKILKEKTGLDIFSNNGNYIHYEEKETFTLVSGHNRGLRYLETPKDENGLYKNYDPILRANYYLEPLEEPPIGYEVQSGVIFKNESVEEFEQREDVIIIRKEDL